jgi:hypothetical protein
MGDGAGRQRAAEVSATFAARASSLEISFDKNAGTVPRLSDERRFVGSRWPSAPGWLFSGRAVLSLIASTY